MSGVSLNGVGQALHCILCCELGLLDVAHAFTISVVFDGLGLVQFVRESNDTYCSGYAANEKREKFVILWLSTAVIDVDPSPLEILSLRYFSGCALSASQFCDTLNELLHNGIHSSLAGIGHVGGEGLG